MAARSRTRPATYADIEALPANMVGEILGGVLYAHPRPASPHARASSKLGAALDGPFDAGHGGPGGWILLDEPELQLGDDVVVPDLAGWRRERMPELVHTSAFSLAPDWVCEVISPSTAAIDRAEKLPIYARERVGHAWLVDPLARTLEPLRREGSEWKLVAAFRDDARFRGEPFDAVELDLARLWAR